MEAKPAAKDEQSYEDFEPFCQWRKEEGFDILEVHLSGFKRQDVKVQINNLGILTISGAQPIDEETTSPPSRFRKEIKVSKKCTPNRIRAKFSRGILFVIIPNKDSNLSTTQLPEHSKESAGSVSGETKNAAENTTCSSIIHYFGRVRSKFCWPKLSKEIALQTVVVGLIMALGGCAIYIQTPKLAAAQN